MNDRVFRSIDTPIRENLTWTDRWKGEDQGLINCWEVGRQFSQKHPDLSARAKAGELPVLDWKGGIENKLKAKLKYGTLFYLAQWQGLRDENLDIKLFEEREVVCSRTHTKVVFTGDTQKYSV